MWATTEKTHDVRVVSGWFLSSVTCKTTVRANPSPSTLAFGLIAKKSDSWPWIDWCEFFCQLVDGDDVSTFHCCDPFDKRYCFTALRSPAWVVAFSSSAIACAWSRVLLTINL